MRGRSQGAGMSLYDDFLLLLDDAVERCGNARRLAALLGVHANLITRWQNGDRKPNITTLQQLADFMGARLVWERGPSVPDAPEKISLLLHRNRELEADLAAAQKTAATLERIVTAGLRREALPEDEKKDDDK